MHAKQVAAIAVLGALAGGAGDLYAGDAPATGVPEALIRKMDQALAPPGGKKMTRQQYVRETVSRMGKVIELGATAERSFPNAPNLYLVQMRMLLAADVLARTTRSPQAETIRLTLARKVLSSGAPLEAKVTADYFVTRRLVLPTAEGPRPTAEKEIRDFVDRYARTPEHPAALARGVQLASEAGQKRLRWHLLNTLERDYAHIPTIHALLRRNGRKPPFAARLTLLDGRTLTLPDDLLGKVYVVHFWATWSVPSTASLPALRRAWQQYRDKGVVFLSVSFDKAEDRPTLLKTIREKQLDWLHAFSGKHLQDPLLRQYGLQSLPSVWVIGRDGRVFSDNARYELERTLFQALSQPAPGKPPKPAGKPAGN